MTKKIVNSDLLITEIVKGIEDVKGENISILDLREIENTVCDYFIVCDGNSNTQVSAISGSIQKKVSKAIKDKPWHV
ncbi:MAG: RsfS/YbeB/iojap family protein, partial [Flavobacteriaceae bacterium]|nr:RsfS/YbeB/iojap family protein [Flavobacteriaceae bacterium]